MESKNNKRQPISKKLRFEIFKRDSFKCCYCGKDNKFNIKLEIDHVKPVTDGGGNSIDNLVTSCFDCNRGKSANPLNVNDKILKRKMVFNFLQEEEKIISILLESRDKIIENTDIKKYRSEDFFIFIQNIFIDYFGEIIQWEKRHDFLIKKYIKKYDVYNIVEAVYISIKKHFIPNIYNREYIMDDILNTTIDNIPKIIDGRDIPKNSFLNKIGFYKIKNKFNFLKI